MDQIIIAASTHWDREWYRTFQDFQLRLCDMMNKLLDLLEEDSRFVCYTFDGQSVVLDDYLEIYPENRERIKRLSEEKRLVFGPLYNLPDEFLSGGEALIRNFLLGEEVCREFGGAMKAGYVPDNFGHISQLPQILKGVGIDTAFFFRGTHMDTIKGKEFYWEGPDGSKVLCEYMPLGYWSLKSWGKMGKTAEEHFEEAYETLKKNSALGTFLLINGSDHLYQDPGFTSKIARVQKGFPDLKIRNGSVKEYADLMLAAAAKKGDLNTVRGELRDFRYGPDPTSVTSTRGYIKRLLYETLAETERYAEPLAVMASQLSPAYSYPAGFFTKIWKKICISLGHDGISGCSTDEVMRDIETYLLHGQQTAYRISQLALEEICGCLDLPGLGEDEDYLFLYNPHLFEYNGVIRQKIRLVRKKRPCRDFRIYDMQGNEIQYELLSVGEEVITREFLYNSKEKRYLDIWEINFQVSKALPLGLTVFRIVRSEWNEMRERELFTRLLPSKSYIENECYRIRANEDASLTITEKGTGRVYEGINTYVSRGEIGDEYQHVSPILDQHIFARMTGLSVIANSPLSQTLRISSIMEIPKGMSEDMLGRSKHNRQCSLTTEVTLYQGQSLLTFLVTIDNACRDQILYAKFPAGFRNAREFSFGSFDETERDQKLFSFDPSLKSTQSILKPLQKYVGVVGENGGIQLVTKGLFEYHTKGEEQERELYLTLLRSSSYMFHGLPVSWQDGQQSTTPIVKTPAAGELGILKLEYAIMLGTETVANEAEKYLYPPRFITEQFEKKAPLYREVSFLRCSNDKVGISAVKRHKRENATVIRLYNRSSLEQTAVLETMQEIADCGSLNMLEEFEELLEHEVRSVSLKIPPKKIITLYFSWR